jgi:hypothetical protein
MIRVALRPAPDPARVELDVRAEGEADRLLYWETIAGDPPAPPERLDFAAVAVLPLAMHLRQDLHLEGSVSWTLLAGLEEWADAWVRWRPDLYAPVAVTADVVVDDRLDGPGPLATRGMATFSGGVDGTYAVIANATGERGRRTLDLAACVLVHGFDVTLDDADGFALAAHSAQAILDEVGVPLVQVRTNWREVEVDWQMTFGAALAAVLHLFVDRAGVGVVAADNTYDHLHLPWGTNPVTGPMLGSDRLRMVHPGAARTRTDKCAAIGRYASVREHIRVCWAGDDPGRNCGSCEKCVRTKLNFLAAGVGAVPALGPYRPGELAGIEVGSAAALGIYDELAEDLDSLPDAVAADLRELLARERARHRAQGIDRPAGAHGPPPAPEPGGEPPVPPRVHPPRPPTARRWAWRR